MDLFRYAGLQDSLAWNSNVFSTLQLFKASAAALNFLSLCQHSSPGLATTYICFHIWVPPSAAAKVNCALLPASLSYFHSLFFSYRVFTALRNWSQVFLFPVWVGSVRQMVNSLLVVRTKNSQLKHTVVVVSSAGHNLYKCSTTCSTCCSPHVVI